MNQCQIGYFLYNYCTLSDIQSRQTTARLNKFIAKANLLCGHFTTITVKVIDFHFL